MVLAVCACCAASARADDAAPEQDAATRVLAAIEAGDDAAVAALAAKEQPDPWLVADALCGRGRHDAALAFAKAASRADTRALAAYVESQREAGPEEAARAALAAGNRGLLAKDYAAAWKALEGVQATSAVLRIRLGRGRAYVLMNTERIAEGAKALRAVADAADDLGWLSAAALSFRQSGVGSFQSGDRPAAVRDLMRALDVQVKRSDVGAQMELVDMLSALVGSGPPEAALPILERARTVVEEAGDQPRLVAGLLNLAVAHYYLGHGDTALPLAERAAAVAEEIGHGLFLAKARMQQGLIHSVRTTYAQAIPLFEQALAFFQANGNRAEAAAALEGLAQAYKRQGRLDEALAFSERSLAASEAVGNPALVAQAHITLALVHEDRAELEAALEHHQQALPLLERVGNRAEVAGTLINMGNIYHKRRELPKALDLFERGRALATEVGQRMYAANALGNLGLIRISLREYAAGEAALEEAFAIKSALGDEVAAARDMSNLAIAHTERGRLGKARELYTRARAAFAASGVAREVARMDAGLAAVAFQSGDFEAARVLAERSRAALESLGDSASQIPPLLLLAEVAELRGRLAESVGFAERAVAIAEAGESRVLLAGTLLKVGVLQDKLGQFERGLALARQALAIHEQLEDRQEVAAGLINVGAMLSGAGRSEEAESSIRKGLALAREIGHRPWQATAVTTLALIAAAREDDEAYLALMQEGFALRSEEDGERRHLRAQMALAYAYVRTGHPERAEPLIAAARARAEETGDVNLEVLGLAAQAELHLAKREPAAALAAARTAIGKIPLVGAGLAEGEDSLARDKWYAVAESGVRAAIATGDTEATNTFLETARAGSLIAALGGREQIAEAVVPEPLLKQERAARDRLREAQVRLEDAGAARRLETLRTARAEVVAAEQALLVTVSRIQRAERGGRSAHPRPAALAELQATLGPADALVTYANLGADHRLAALVVTPTAARLVELGPWKDDLEPSGGNLEGEAIQGLQRSLVDPLKLDGKTRRVLVSPTGSLAYVPFSLLLGEREVAYVPSGTTYRTLAGLPKETGKGVLALGDPVYGSGTPGHLRSGRSGRLAPLPATRAEVEAVGDVRLLDRKATEADLTQTLATAPRWHAVHMACHGLIDAERPLLSSLAISKDEQNDGFLTAAEILRLRIPADLVVLSACETALGRPTTTGGMIGFTRAFLLAGADRVLVSLWKVDDEATQALMIKFYELWKTRPAATALREAQSYVASHEEWSHPRYWAAWQLWGLP